MMENFTEQNPMISEISNNFKDFQSTERTQAVFYPTAVSLKV